MKLYCPFCLKDLKENVPATIAYNLNEDEYICENCYFSNPGHVNLQYKTQLTIQDNQFKFIGLADNLGDTDVIVCDYIGNNTYSVYISTSDLYVTKNSFTIENTLPSIANAYSIISRCKNTIAFI
jgi:hypothetical protein